MAWIFNPNDYEEKDFAPIPEGEHRVILKAQSDIFHGVGRYGHSPSSSHQNGQGPLRSLACVASKKGHCQRSH